MKWFFDLIDDVVYLDTRLDDGDTVGDARAEVRQGEEFYGISYAEMAAAGNGVIVVDDKNVGHLFDEDPDESEGSD